MADETQTLESSVDSAAASIAANIDNKETSGTPETPAAEVSTEAKELIHGLTQEELPNAAQIYQALKDPEKAKIFVKFLAENNGYVLPEKKGDEPAPGEPTMADLLREHLGEDFAPFADKLAPALEKIVASQVEKETKPIKERFKNQDAESTQREVNQILSEFGKENFDDGKLPDAVVKEMTKLTKSFTPGEGVDNKTYIGNLLKMAMTNLNIAPKSSRSARSANDPLAFLSNNATSKPSGGKDVAPKKMSIDEAVNEAAKALSSKTN